MIHLFSHCQKLKAQLKNKLLFIFLDYDGTLAPIVDTPKEALLSRKTKTLLRNLAKCPRCKIAIISGRGLGDIKKTVGLKNIIYAGNHGLEITGPEIKLVSPLSRRLKGVIRNICAELKTKLGGTKGVLIEDKGLSLSVHYRLVARKLRTRVKTIFHRITISYRSRQKIKVKAGKMVLEVIPPVSWDKGKAVLWLMATRKFARAGKMLFPIYIGDDTTDEDAFKVVKNKGLALFVGRPKKSFARYYLRNSYEVREFLEQVLAIVKNQVR